MSATIAENAVDAFIARVGTNCKPFSIEMPDGRVRTVGDSEPVFRAALRNDRAVKAVRGLDEGKLAEAYMRGDIDLDGDMLQPFALRASLADRHLVANVWRFLQPLLFGQVYTNKQAIKSHYDANPRLFLSFLDETYPAYSQGVYESDDEQLATALERKFNYAVERCELGPGKRVLEIGPGWGAFAGYALQLDTDFTGITISTASQDYLTRTIERRCGTMNLVRTSVTNSRCNHCRARTLLNTGFGSWSRYDRCGVPHALRRTFDYVAAEPVPERLRALIETLERNLSGSHTSGHAERAEKKCPPGAKAT